MTELLLNATTSSKTTFLVDGDIIITQMVYITIIRLTQVSDTKW